MRPIPYILLLMVLWVRPLAAESPARVVIAPVVYVDVEEPTLAASVTSAVLRGVEAELRAHAEQFELVDRTDVRELVTGRPAYQESLTLAASWTELGITKYKELDSEGAVKSLEQATTIYQSVRWDLVEPYKMAEVLMYLALAHLDLRRDLARPLQLMAEMVRLDPTRVLKKGFYPDDIVQFYNSARETLERDLRSGTYLEHSRQLAAMADARFVVSTTVVEVPEGYQILMHWYDSDKGALLAPESIDVLSLIESGVAEAGSRLASRFVACLREPSPMSAEVAPSAGKSPWAVELNFAYASFLVFPEPQMALFGNYGASVGVNYSLTREFALLIATQILTSTRDKDGFLNDDFTTLRGFGGVGLGYSFGPLRTEVSMLLEGATMGQIKVCDDINEIIPGCSDDDANYSVHEYDVLFGVNARPRLKLQVLSSFEVLVGASGSFYFFPLSDRSLNLPITVESGLQYRF